MSSKKLIHRGLAAIIAVFMLLSIVTVGLPTTVYADGQGTTYYVDSEGGDDGNTGISDSTAWKTITKLNDVTFMPGDNILLKAGSVWNNQYLELKGSGTSASAIVIDKYGDGSKPVINGNGDGVTVDGSYKAVIALYNQQYWEINNLEITNDDIFSQDDDSDVHRRAISIIAANMGAVNHIT